MNLKNTLIKLIKLGMGYQKIFWGTLLVSIVLAIVAVARPYIIIEMTNTVILVTDITKESYKDLFYASLILLSLTFFETVLSYFLSFYSNVLAQNVIKDLRVRLFSKLLQFKSSYFDKTPNGVLITRSVSDIETIATVYNDGILLFFGDILRILVVLLVMFAINWKITLAILFIFPIMYIVTRLFQKAIKVTFTNERNYTSELNAFVQERLSGMNLIQLFNRHRKEAESFSEINKKLLGANLKTVFYFSLFFPVVELISALAIGLIIYFGGKEIIKNPTLDIGIIIGFVFYVQMLIKPLRQIADRFNTLQRGVIGAERVMKLIDLNEQLDDNGTTQLTKINGDIEFKNVAFSYIPNEKIIKDLSFKVEAGQKIAVVGATGAGKSTLINLLSRFYEIDHGSIEIDGINIKDFPLANLRKHIGVVLQDVFLFNDTLYHNIILGDTTISKEKVMESAKIIGIHEFIEQLPGTYDYVVNERGSSLSLGQRQLISFLRAYVYNPSILVLDEATSSIDTYSEELIQKATDRLTQNRTSIIIAHRLATIQSADRILVMDKGRLIESGTHQELLDLKKQYFRLYQSQFQSTVKT